MAPSTAPRVVLITCVDDRLAHLVTDDAHAAGIAAGTGHYTALCGRQVAAQALVSPPRPAVSAVRRTGRSAARGTAAPGRAASRGGERPVIAPVLWATSGYDGQCHAFPVGQAADRNRAFYEARCSHTVPPDQLTTTQGPTGPLCVACAAIVGSELPDPGRHGTAPPP